MEKKEPRNANNMKNQNIENKELKPSAGKRSKSDKSLPWWVELLFVQIGLPDKYLIKILKTNKNFKELLKSEKQFLSAFLVILIAFVYFYPVVKQSKRQLECENNAKDYILKKKNRTNIDRKNLKMIATNFCNGGDELNLIEN